MWKHLKKSRYDAVHNGAKMKDANGKDNNILGLCRCAEMSRQNYYVSRKRRKKEAVDTEFIISFSKRNK